MSTTELNAAVAAAGSSDPQDLGPYFIQQLLPTHYVLDVDGGGTAPSTPILTWTRKSTGEGNTNQQWKFVPAPANTPGWWFLQTNMGTGFVMTLSPETNVQPTPIVMARKGATIDGDLQLWCLLPTEKLGYWYIQNKRGASNSQTPMVIGLDGDKKGAFAVARPLSFTQFETQAWGFSPVLR